LLDSDSPPRAVPAMLLRARAGAVNTQKARVTPSRSESRRFTLRSGALAGAGAFRPVQDCHHMPDAADRPMTARAITPRASSRGWWSRTGPGSPGGPISRPTCPSAMEVPTVGGRASLRHLAPPPTSASGSSCGSFSTLAMKVNRNSCNFSRSPLAAKKTGSFPYPLRRRDVILRRGKVGARRT